MKNPEHRKIISSIVLESLSTYDGFAEVEELKALVSAWVEGRIEVVDSVPCINFSSTDDAVGCLPAAYQSVKQTEDLDKTNTPN